jgi:hypothetical protein
MIEYRVTKYDRASRDARDAYTKQEWTSVTDIGRAFAGVVLTDGRISTCRTSLPRLGPRVPSRGRSEFTDSGGLENHKGLALEFGEGSVLPVEQVGDLIRRILRGAFWCRLKGQGGFVHFGWDYYMYIGVPHRCLEAEQLAEELGLYPEELPHPTTKHHASSFALAGRGP